VGTNVYGWVQQGFAGNIDSPRDRINFGANLDWRSNDYRLNQAYFIVEKALQHEDKWDIGYRVDFLVGHDWHSVIIRPELRVDWSPDARPYNDQTKKVQFVPAVDMIVRF